MRFNPELSRKKVAPQPRHQPPFVAACEFVLPYTQNLPTEPA
jgi:hypothetical protein